MNHLPQTLQLSMLCSLCFLVGCDGPEESEPITAREYPLLCDQYDGLIPGFKFDQELVIKKLSAVEDACRTAWTGFGCGTKLGKWTAWNLFFQMAGNTDPSALIHEFFRTSFYPDQPVEVNGRQLSKRDLAKNVMLGWRKQSGCNDDLKAPCALNKDKAPFRLLAFVNRQDLRDGSYGQGGGGEGRLVFNILKYDPNNWAAAPKKSQANIIFEFNLPNLSFLPGTNAKLWAERWHKLSTPNMLAEDYNIQLQTQLTDVFATAANLAQIRTAEIEYDPAPLPQNKTWSFREYELRCPLELPNCLVTQRRIFPRAVAQTPDSSMNNAANLQHLELYLNSPQVSEDILAGINVVPDTFNGIYFRGAESLASKASNSTNRVLWGVNKDTFEMVNLTNNQPFKVRHMFGVTTCNGCHYDETDTNMMFIAGRDPNVESVLAPFLNTSTVKGATHNFYILPFDGDDNWYFQFNEPRRRVCEAVHASKGNALPLTQPNGAPH